MLLPNRLMQSSFDVISEVVILLHTIPTVSVQMTFKKKDQLRKIVQCCFRIVLSEVLLLGLKALSLVSGVSALRMPQNSF